MAFELLGLGLGIILLIIFAVVIFLWLGGFALLLLLFKLLIKIIVWIISVPLSFLGKKTRQGIDRVSKSNKKRGFK